MGNSVQQWRSSIGRWCCSLKIHMAKSFDWESCLPDINYFMLAVLAVLLVISGIEMNPGPIDQHCEEMEKMLRLEIEQKMGVLRKELEQQMEQQIAQLRQLKKQQVEMELEKARLQMEQELQSRMQEEQELQRRLQEYQELQMRLQEEQELQRRLQGEQELQRRLQEEQELQRRLQEKQELQKDQELQKRLQEEQELQRRLQEEEELQRPSQEQEFQKKLQEEEALQRRLEEDLEIQIILQEDLELQRSFQDKILQKIMQEKQQLQVRLEEGKDLYRLQQAQDLQEEQELQTRLQELKEQESQRTSQKSLKDEQDFQRRLQDEPELQRLEKEQKFQHEDCSQKGMEEDLEFQIVLLKDLELQRKMKEEIPEQQELHLRLWKENKLRTLKKNQELERIEQEKQENGKTELQTGLHSVVQVKELQKMPNEEKLQFGIAATVQLAAVPEHRYKKTTGFANMKGELYEVKLAALLFARGLVKRQNFCITSNMVSAGAFDDIVLKLGQKTMLLQLKHIENSRKEISKSQLIHQEKGKFSLLRYYKSYCEVKQQWEHDVDLQLCGRFEDAMFVVYTTIGLAEGLGNEVGNADLQHVLSSGGKCVSFSENTCLLQSVNEPAYKKFLSQLWFFTEQAAESQLDDLIKKELRDLCGTDTVHTQFLSEVENWWRNSNTFLTDKALFWQNIVQSRVAEVSQQKLKEIEHLDITFNETQQTLPRTLMMFVQALQIIPKRNNDCSLLSCLKIYNCLGSECHLFVDVSTLQSHFGEVLALWSRWCDLLIVVGDEIAVVDSLADILHNCPGKRLVLIAGTVAWSNPQYKYTTLRDDVTFEQLDEASQAKVLAAVVHFQGHDVPLAAITGSNQHCVPGNDIVKLLTQKLVLGAALTGDLDYYISRTLQLACQVRDEVLSHITDSPLTLAVSGLSRSELDQLVLHIRDVHTARQLVKKENKCKIELIRSEEDFLRLVESCKTVHWLHRENNVFIWKQSKGDIAIILQYLSDKNGQFERVDSFMNVPHQVVVLSAEPGMGKSTLMTHLSLGTKQTHPAMWVIRVNLNDFTQHLGKLPKNFSLEHTVEFLLHVSEIREEWKYLFRSKLTNMENVCILFDGYDEISPTHSDKVALLLRCLQATKVHKLWVTTRPVMRQKLEQELCTLAVTLEPFSITDQRTFLFKFWSKSVPDIEKAKLKKFISDLLLLTEKNINDRDRKFMGIPLQSLLLAEVFEDKLTTYSATGEFSLPKRFDLLHLYNKFVDRKLEIYYEKNNIDMTKPGSLTDYEEIKLLFQRNHMISALLALLPSEDISNLHISESDKERVQMFLTAFKAGKEKRGIVKQVVNNKPLFIHRTFAEYFSALWFTRNWESVQGYLEKKLFDKNFQIVRNFFNRMLAQNCDLHVAVLNYDKDSVQTFLLEQQQDVNMRDMGGRTALHLAVMCYLDVQTESRADENNDDNQYDESSSIVLSEIIAALLEHGADLTIEDKVLRWRPLRLADRIRAWTAIDLLLQRRADSSDLALTRQNTSDAQFVDEVLAVASRRGLIQLVVFMLECGVLIGHRFSTSFKFKDTLTSMLHIAATYGQLELIKCLVAYNAHIDARDDWKRTALICAAGEGHLQIVQYLIEIGASTKARDVHGDTALLSATKHDHVEIFKLLSQHSDYEVSDNERSTALHRAAMSGNAELGRYILDTLKLGIDCCNRENETALWHAALRGNLEFTELLCERGANLHVQDSNSGCTALHVAAEKGHLQVVECLVWYGASLTIRDKCDYTPLQLALYNKKANVADYLQQITH